MRVVLIDPSLFTLPYDVRLATGLQSLGNDVILVGQDPGREQETDVSEILHRHFYPGFTRPFMRKLPTRVYLALKGLSHTTSMIRLLRRMKDFGPDVIHFQWTPLALIDRHFIPRLKKIAPTVLTVHDSAPFNNNPRAHLQRLGAIRIMSCFDGLIVHTDKARDRLLGYGLDADKISVVPHGLLGEIAPSASGTRVNGPVRLLLFGHLKPYKGIDVLLRAIAALPSELKHQVQLRVVGRPKMHMGHLFELAESLGISSQVEFDLRFVPESEIALLLEAAEILMFPYREIDASGVLMLAIAAAKPIVASNLGLFRELLKNGVHGALVEPGNPAALSSALADLLSDRIRLSEAAVAVRRLALTIPTWHQIGAMTENVYRLAADRSR